MEEEENKNRARQGVRERERERERGSGEERKNGPSRGREILPSIYVWKAKMYYVI